MNKALRKFVKMVEAEGLSVEAGGKHYKVLDMKGNRVGTVSTTGETNALKQAIRDLDRQGLLKDGKEARKVKF